MSENAESDVVELADGTQVPASEAVFVDRLDEWHPRSSCRQREDDSWILAIEAVFTYDGEWHLKEDCHRLTDGEYAHEDNEDIVYLDGDDSGYTYRDNAVEVDGCYFDIEDCRQCDTCDDWHHADNISSAPNGHDDICDRCISRHCCYCDSCGEIMWSDDACSDPDGDGSYHEDCAPGRSSKLVVNYGNKDSIRLPSDTPRNLRNYGIELEVEGKVSQQDAAEFARQTLSEDYCVFKEDGSLSSKGFEIVTRWDSMAVHREAFAKFFASNPSKHMTSWESGNCGMHVHVDKTKLSPLQMGKMLCFINSLDNKSMIVSIAGRESDYAEIIPKKVSDALKPTGRTALNITRFSNEFRIFRGTLKPESFYKNLEFVDALVQFCHPGRRSIDTATCGKEFCKWLPKQDYPHLHAHLVKHKFVQ